MMYCIYHTFRVAAADLQESRVRSGPRLARGVGGTQRCWQVDAAEADCGRVDSDRRNRATSLTSALRQIPPGRQQEPVNYNAEKNITT